MLKITSDHNRMLYVFTLTYVQGKRRGKGFTLVTYQFADTLRISTSCSKIEYQEQYGWQNLHFQYFQVPSSL